MFDSACEAIGAPGQNQLISEIFPGAAWANCGRNLTLLKHHTPNQEGARAGAARSR
jgi:hypothetical protein